MKKLFLFFFSLYYCVVFPQSLMEAPQNPAFTRYMQGEKKISYTKEGYPLQYIPPPVTNYFQSSTQKLLNVFPAQFDLRDSAYITTVKNQGACGCCWAFATLGSMESNWLKNKFGTFDLSEENMKNCHGFEVGGCTSGNAEMAEAYLTRGSGPVIENENPYVAANKPCANGFSPVALITSAVYLPKDMQVIKQAILDHGGLYASMYWQNSSYNTANKTYYYSGVTDENHAVIVVGWDDNRSTAGGVGAWIAKNSWGTSWGEQGYFYISYNDSKFLSSVTFFPTRMEFNNQGSIYCYDKLGRTSDLGYSSPEAFGLVKFSIAAKQKLTKIGMIVNTENAILDVEVFTHIFNDKLYNRVYFIKDYVCQYPGYITIDLPEPVHFNSGEEMYIKVRYNTPGNNFPLPFERFVANYANPEIEKNVCWVSSNGESWEPFGNNISSKERDLCIRAYMLPDTVLSIVSTDLKIYPNPTNGIVNIEFLYPEKDAIQINLFNETGELLYPVSFEKGEMQFIQRLDLSGLGKGFYYIHVKSQNYSKIYKLIFI